MEKTFISETAYVARFGLPDTTKALGLSTCACILAGAEIDGEMTVRPYTPISTNADLGTKDKDDVVDIIGEGNGCMLREVIEKQ